jgi:hypothetical protein
MSLVPKIHTRLSLLAQRVSPVGLILLVVATSRPLSAQTPEPIPTPLRTIGTGSCAAAACHGGRREPLGLKGSEYTFWATYDPHRKGYSILFDERSKRIERNYRGLASIDAAEPESDATCLSCHVRQKFEPKDVKREEYLLADGVGCESCHGPAERWLVPHTEAGWKGLSDRQKQEQFGLVNTKDLTTRISMCANCHLGSADAEVNHDLIAAGHPRLLYEFANQQGKHPKHWRIEDEKARYPDYEVRAWALGQVVSAKASFDLVESRASRSSDKIDPAPWPEFTEYDCFACHHDLKLPSSRQESGRLGSLAWGTWTIPGLKQVSELRSGGSFGSKDTAVEQLEVLMSRTGPDSAKVASLARAASREVVPLIERVEHQPFSRRDVESLLATSFQSPDAPKPTDWTESARAYLTIVALSHARTDLGGASVDPTTLNRLASLREVLSVPIVRPTDGRLVDSPFRFDSKTVTGEFRSLRDSFPR